MNGPSDSDYLDQNNMNQLYNPRRRTQLSPIQHNKYKEPNSTSNHPHPIQLLNPKGNSNNFNPSSYQSSNAFYPNQSQSSTTTYFCFKCWKEIPITERKDHVLLHDIQDHNMLNPDSNNSKPSRKQRSSVDHHQQNPMKNSSLIPNESNDDKYSFGNCFLSSNEIQKLNDIVTQTNKQKGHSNQSNANNHKGYSENNIVRNLNIASPPYQMDNIHHQNTYGNKMQSKPKAQDLREICDKLEVCLIESNQYKVREEPKKKKEAERKPQSKTVIQKKPVVYATKLEEIIAEIPETLVESPDIFEGDNKECTICLAEFKRNDIYTFLPCIHYFHSKCIKNWLLKKQICPMCLTNPFD